MTKTTLPSVRERMQAARAALPTKQAEAHDLAIALQDAEYRGEATESIEASLKAAQDEIGRHLRLLSSPQAQLDEQIAIKTDLQREMDEAHERAIALQAKLELAKQAKLAALAAHDAAEKDYRAAEFALNGCGTYTARQNIERHRNQFPALYAEGA